MTNIEHARDKSHLMSNGDSTTLKLDKIMVSPLNSYLSFEEIDWPFWKKYEKCHVKHWLGELCHIPYTNPEPVQWHNVAVE